jgi:TolB-like protein
MNLFDELRHRNVIRVAIAYVVVGWLVAQVADLIVDAFNLPDNFLQMIIVLLLLGFPIAVVFAWAFELTPENRITTVTLLIAVAWLGWDKLQRPAADPATDTADMSIAVLPFADFSPDSDHAWFADGLTDEILNALARTRSLRVASRTSSFAYRATDKDARSIAAELEVGHILEGSVRRAGDRIRVTAQLIRASDDAHLWSDTFDADSADSIEIQERIALDIASLLDTAMDPAELRRMVAAGTETIAAWEAYVRARELYYRSLSEFDTVTYSAEILALYQQAIAADPGFGEAHLMVARLANDWLDPSNITSGPPGMSAAAIRAVFTDAAAAASRYARSEDARLGAEILRATAQIRLGDLADLTRARLPFHPESREVWGAHLDALIRASRFDEARDFVREIEAHDFGHNEQWSLLNTAVARAHVPAGLAAVDELLALPAPQPADLYQAHRILLFGDRLAEAAVVGQRYLDIATDPTWSLMIELRQACAEGRLEDAEALYADFDFSGYDIANINIQWLALQTLGRTAEAESLLLPLDTSGRLSSLASLLTYTHFDPSLFPNLTRHLEEQGAMRHEVTPLSFACKRQVSN